MKLISLSMKNFLGTKERSIGFTELTEISGRNGSGKSSVKEAIIFALYGKINGKAQNLDSAILNGEKDMSVVLTVEMDGKTYIVERILVGSGGTVKVNGKITDSAGLEIIFGIYEEFCSQVCAGDFMKFDEATRYSIINSIFPGDLEQIYRDMVGEDIAKEYPYSTIDEKQIKTAIKTAQDKQNEIHHKKLMISSKIEELEKTPAPKITIPLDLLEQSTRLIADHESIKPELKNDVTFNTDEVQLLKSTKASLEKQFRDHLDSKPAREELDRIATLFKHAEQELNAIDKGDVCPTCLRIFDKKEKELQRMQAENKMQQYLSEGKRAKQEYTDHMFGWEEERIRIEKELASVSNKLTVLSETAATGNLGAVEHYKKELQLWQERMDELKNTANEYNFQYKSERNALTQWNTLRDSIDSYKEELANLDKELTKIDYHKLDKIKECFGAKGIEFQDIQSKIDKIRGYLPEGVELELIQPNKTNEGFKKVFNIKQDGVSYNWLSKGMRKVLDIHICEMLSNKKVIIIDDLESLTSSIQLVNSDIQLVTMTAVDKDFAIKSKSTKLTNDEKNI